MRICQFLTLVVLVLLLTLSVQGQQADPSSIDHETPQEHIEEELDITQPAGPRGTGMGSRGMATPRPTTAPTRTRTPGTPDTPRTPRTPRTARTPGASRMGRPGMMFPRPRLSDMLRDPMPGMTPGMARMARLERRMMMNMFRALLQLRMRAMLGVPMSRWEMRMIRMMALRDMMMMMDVQAEDATELANMIDQRQADMDENTDPETYDDSETQTEPESEHESETVPDHEEAAVADHEVEDPTLIEAEFDIAEPFGGFGGYGGFGGFGGKKGGFGFGGKKGGFGFGFGGGKKVPYKKVPFKKVPYKKGGFGGGGFGGPGFI